MSKGKPTAAGFIYFMRRADGVGPVKIGCSKMPEHRLKNTLHWSPEPLEIVAAVPGTFADEERLHRQFAEYRLHCEWFEAAPPVLAAVTRAASLGQLPPRPADDRNVRIMARYAAGDTLEVIGSDLGVTRQRIEQIVRKEGGAKRGRGGRKRAPVWKKIEQARSLAGSGCTLAEIADALGDAYQNVVNACRANGITVRKAKKAISARITARAFDIAAEYKAGITTAEIARKFNLQQPEIYRHLRIAGVKPNRVTRSTNRFVREDAIAAYKGGATLGDLAETFGCSVQTVRLHPHKAGVLRTREESEAIRIARVTAANRRRHAA